ncbi:MAG: DJ-1/PfpI family protein [Hyphomicrobiaceae bacterium]
MSMTKRDLLGAMAVAMAGGQLAATATATEAARQPDHDMAGMPASWHGSEKIAFLAYPEFTSLDLVGPHYMLGSLMGATTMIVARTREPVVSDMKLAILPTHTFAECPADLDIICVPGGSTGTLAAMQDAETIAFLKDRGARAKYVTSVCTGSLVLGAAGLLDGYKATSHWVTRHLLAEFGAEPVDKRVVIDRNRITGAGVTAGLDMGLHMLGQLRDPLYAQSVQLLAEYAPEPPYTAGTPASAPVEARTMMAGMFTGLVADMRDTARRIRGQR